MGMQPLNNTPEQRRWPGMPEKILNMDWEDLMDLVQEVREELDNCEDAGGSVLALCQKFSVDPRT